MNAVMPFPPRGGSLGQSELPPLTRWLPASELDESWVYRPGMLLLGHDGAPGQRGRFIGINENRHIVTTAGSRAGKTLSLLVPNLLVYPGSSAVIDPKGELAGKTAEARRKAGQRVFVLDPFRMPHSTLPASSHYNPFDDLKRSTPESLPADVAQLADALIEGNKKDPHWTDSAKNLLVGLILLDHTREPGGATLRSVRRKLTDPDLLEKAWTDMMLSDAFDGRLASIGRSFLAKLKSGGGEGNRELQSILSTAQEQTRPLDDVAHISDRSDFSFEEFATQPTTIYLVLPALRISTHARWLRVIIYQLLAALERNPVPVDPASGRYPLRLVLEEFASLGYMQAIETAAGYIAGFGVQLWAVLQDLTQIRTHYPNSWETFLGNAGVINGFGIVDGTTTQYLSRLFGNTTILESRQTRLNAAGVKGGDPGYDSSPRMVPLMEPAEITLHFARETGRQFVKIPGLPPIHMSKLNWRTS